MLSFQGAITSVGLKAAPYFHPEPNVIKLSRPAPAFRIASPPSHLRAMEEIQNCVLQL
jgi:hypothetical protein